MKQFPIQQARNLVNEFFEFVAKAVSPFHVTSLCKEKLTKSGFTELNETENWKLEKGGKYFFTRNLTTIVAFTVGQQFDPNNTGFKIIGAHTDSPCLRLAPVSKLDSNGFLQTCVSTYGGGLWHTWFDRELTLGGRIIFQKDNVFQSQLFHYQQPLLKIPNLAIHLTTDRNSFAPNNESNLRPVFAQEAYQTLTGIEKPKTEGQTSFENKHYKYLLNLITEQTGIPTSDILDIDLYFSDCQPPSYFGLNQEFISAARIDNLFSSFFALLAITNPESFTEDQTFINMICLYDHEEVGSQSAQGADSSLLSNNMKRIYDILSNSTQTSTDSFYKAIQKSFLISSDMAHSIHPNYSDKHQQNHRVKMNEGIVIKINHNQRYATDGVSSAILRVVAQSAEVPIQDFIVRNDSPCGSTIGPLQASNTGIKTIDIGAAQWGMHSIRETAGVVDGYYLEKLFVEFYRKYEKIDHKLLGI
ncbi:unnamed protein product [Paramecium pentaurelia]|uniref:aspartyl aminopeptidase n=1 Tax=Paramecium pentaurelia TaxID=43138 RepID=A0A8S1XIY8_9CILI|nr:unnamed protein product [Paramecium pentaurelia]